MKLIDDQEAISPLSILHHWLGTVDVNSVYYLVFNFDLVFNYIAKPLHGFAAAPWVTGQMHNLQTHYIAYIFQLRYPLF